MKIIITKADLIEALSQFKDSDRVIIALPEDFKEDHYSFFVDPIHMGLDKDFNDRGTEIQLCPLENN